MRRSTRTGRSTARSADAVAAARGTAALAVSQVATRALGLGFVLAATRALTPSDLGRYAVASALLLGAATIADFGTTSVATKLVSRDPGGSGNILAAVVLPSLVLGVLSFGALQTFVVVFDYPMITRIDALVVGLGLPADAVLTSLLGGFDGRGLLTRRALLSLLRSGLSVGGGLVAVLLTADVRIALVALAAGPNITLAATVVASRRCDLWKGNIRIDSGMLRKIVSLALPFALLGGINVIVMRADVVILSLLAHPAEVARYDVALRTTEAFAFLGTVIAAPSLFILSRRLGQDDVAGTQRAFDEAIRLAYLVGLPLSAALVALGEPLAAAVFGSRYRSSGILLTILGLQLWLALIAAIQGSLLLAGPRLRAAVKLFAILAALAVLIEIAAIGFAGAGGAALAMVAVQSMIVVGAAIFSRRQTGIFLRLPPIGAVVAAVVSGGIMAACASLWVPWSVLIGAGTYAAVVIATGAVNGDDARRMRRQLRPTSF